MFLVKNFINNLLGIKTKDEQVIESWWKRDPKNLINKNTICDLRGHVWSEFANGDRTVMCKICKKIQVLKFDGNEGP